jgi:hypothetical protein
VNYGGGGTVVSSRTIVLHCRQPRMRIADGVVGDSTSQTSTITEPHSRHLGGETLIGNATISALIYSPSCSILSVIRRAMT